MDPISTALRWRLVIYRRKYSVPTPNALWHFDSADKLIRWKLVVHVCIDGFSSLLIYCTCCDNNRAETVLKLFREGTQTYGIPSRARCDYGMENLLDGQFMLEQRGVDRQHHHGIIHTQLSSGKNAQRYVCRCLVLLCPTVS